MACHPAAPDGVVPTVHRYVWPVGNVSVHRSVVRSRKNAERTAERRYEIQDYPNWHADGHREIHCECGRASISRRAWLDERGRGCTRVEGRCKACGTISITSGRWRRALNPHWFVRWLPGEEPDYLFGNPLTFNDQLAPSTAATASAARRVSTACSPPAFA